jgi:homogentisate 1,2-dioxygenase
VLTAPIDDRGRSALDLGVFRGRWDVAEHTFRPPFFHRNSAIEFNGVIASTDPRWPPGTATWTPYLTPHGISTESYESAITAPPRVAEPPVRIADASLWIQFESAYAMKILPWMIDHEARVKEHLAGFGVYRPGARVS